MTGPRGPAAGRAAAVIANRLRGWQDGQDWPSKRLEQGQLGLLRRVLEEAGIRCEESEELDGLAGFLIASPRGTEIVLSSRLSESERLLAYAHLLAHVMIGRSEHKLMARFKYPPGQEPGHQTEDERREDSVAEALARAILAGRLEGAPRYLYGSIALPSPREGMPRAAVQTLLVALHYASMILYWRSTGYQQLRSLPAFAGLVTRVKTLLGDGEPLAA